METGKDEYVANCGGCGYSFVVFAAKKEDLPWYCAKCGSQGVLVFRDAAELADMCEDVP